jgi:4-hydroxy-tetrahydrodipicolinate synthase
MASLQLNDTVRGIIVPLVSPLDAQDRLDRVGLERVIEHVLDGGVSGLFILGTTGEGPSLSHRLRTELVRAVCRQVSGRAPVLVGVSDTAYEETLAMARVADQAGAAAVVLAPPSYFRISQDDLLGYLERFACNSPLPVFLYNIPSLTKTAFEPETVRRAAAIGGIVGLKDSSGDLAYLGTVVRCTGTRLPVMIGPEELLLEGMQAGAVGGVCGGANLHPRLYCDLRKAAASGDVETAQRLQARVREISDALYTVGDRSTSYLRGLKWAMAASGLCSGLCALPFAPFTRQEQQLLASRLEMLGTAV